MTMQSLFHRGRSISALSIAAALLAGCGGSGGGEPAAAAAPVPALFASAPVWGDASAALPPGARLLSMTEFEQALQGQQVHWMDPTQRRAAVDAVTAQRSADLQTVQAAATTDPALAAMLAQGATPGSEDQAMADGNVRLAVETAAGTERFIVHGRDFLVGEAAEGLRAYASRDNAEKLYANFHAQLADDQREDLPAPGALAAVDLPALQTLIDTMAQRLLATLPNASAPAETTVPGTQGGGRARPLSARVLALTGSGCTHMNDLSAVVDLDFALKPHLPPIRSQGKRGTCVSFGINGAVETRIAKTFNRKPDLSEQHVYAHAKGFWQPTPNAYGDGLQMTAAMGEIGKVGGSFFTFHTEGGWAYNASPNRIDDEAGQKYLVSCLLYPQACSDTNHQMGTWCTQVPGYGTFCANTNPQLPANDVGAEHYRLQGYNVLTRSSGSETVAAMAASLVAGQPVAFGAQVTDCLRKLSPVIKVNGVNQPHPERVYMNSFFCLQYSNVIRGGHAMTAVGIVTHQQLVDRFGSQAPANDGGYYFIVRNSWGCGWGDGGYGYISANYLATVVTSAVAVTQVGALLPQLSINASKSQFTQPGNLTLTASGNAIVTRVEIYRGSAGLGYTKLLDKTGSPFSVSIPLGVVDNGSNLFFAYGYDKDGNKVISNLVSVKVAIPGAPNVWLSATPTPATAPGPIELKAIATDDTGIAKVEFIAGLTKLGEKTAPPYTWTFDATLAHVGTLGFVARATDTQGNQTFSSLVSVDVLPAAAPKINSFKALPAFVSTRGGTATLSWDVDGAELVTISGVGAVAASGTIDVFLTTSRTFTLSATNMRGTSTWIDVVQAVPPPTLSDLTITPASLPNGGGEVTLRWKSANALRTFVLKNGAAQVVTVNPDGLGYAAQLTIDATATLGVYVESAAADWVKLELPVTVGADSQPPVIGLTVSSTSVTLPGPLTLSASASDNVGVSKVEFLRNGVKFAEKTAAPFTQAISIDASLNGTQQFTAIAHDAAGNSATSAAVAVVVNIDATAPTVSLAAAPTALTAPGSTTLTATASDNVGVTRVEFWQGSSLLGQVTQAPFTWVRSFAGGETGSFDFMARAFDAAGNAAASATVVVTVALPPQPTGWYVDPVNGSDANAGTNAAPFKTLGKAFTFANPGHVVWLKNGLYTAAGEGTNILDGRQVPAGVTLQAVNDDGATMGFPLRLLDGSAVVGLRMDMSSNAEISSLGGSSSISRPTWVKLGAGTLGDAIRALGSSKITLDPKGSATHNYVGSPGLLRIASVSSTAELTINGGVIDGLTGGGSGYMASVTGAGRLVLNGVNWTNTSSAVVAATAIDINGDAGRVTLANTTIDLSGAVELNNGGNACIRVRGQDTAVSTVRVTLTGSTLRNCPGDAIQLRNGSPGLTLTDSLITGSGFYGVHAGNVFSLQNPAVPILEMSNSSITGSQRAAIDLNNGGALQIVGGSFSSNGSWFSEGGIRLLGTQRYLFSLRGAAVTQNSGSASSGGLLLQGAATSTFDLGTQASPGGNFIFGNGVASTGLRLSVGAGVRVDAVGNTWLASTQGSSGAGTYTSSSTACGGANPCNVTGGSGANFAFTGAGTGAVLRLVHD